MRVSDNALVLLLVLVAVSTCGKPDVWDGAAKYLMKESECLNPIQEETQ